MKSACGILPCNDAAAKNRIAVIEHGGLARRDGAQRLVEDEAHTVCPCRIDRAGLLRLTVARFRTAPERKRGRFTGDPVHAGNEARSCKQRLVRADDDGVPLRQIADRIEELYGVKLRLIDDDAPDANYNFSFQKDTPIEDVIELLQFISGTRFEILRYPDSD